MKKEGRISSILVIIIALALAIIIFLLFQLVFSSGFGKEEAAISLSTQTENQIKANYNRVTLTSPQMRSALNYFKDTKDIAVYLNDDIHENNASLKEISLENFSKNNDSNNKLYLISNVYIYGAQSKIVEGSPRNLSVFNVSNGFYKRDVSGKTDVARVLATLEGKAKYRSVLITNEATSNIIGVYFQRYE